MSQPLRKVYIFSQADALNVVALLISRRTLVLKQIIKSLIGRTRLAQDVTFLRSPFEWEGTGDLEATAASEFLKLDATKCAEVLCQVIAYCSWETAADPL